MEVNKDVIQFRVEQACTASETFSKLFYETLDKRRHIISKFYMTDATLLWNGHYVTGEPAIGQFYGTLPTSETSVVSLNAMPVSDAAVNGVTTILVHTSGTLSFQNKAAVPFFETFLLTVQDEKWKIISDSFRFQE